MTLDRNVSNFFAENEQVAFGTGVLVDGLDFSDDKMLVGRTFSSTPSATGSGPAPAAARERAARSSRDEPPSTARWRTTSTTAARTRT